MADQNPNLSNMSEEEFKKQLLQWVEKNDVSSSLQSKLRKDLFDSFNSTSLGRLIAAQHIRAHRIVLSPLVLVLNTLVAEFLYSQDCHFTLSVFSTEAPYKNTLPDFEAQRKFRFNTTELGQIFEAINITPEIKDIVTGLYVTPCDDQVNTSLLYSLLRIILPSAEIGHSKGTQTSVSEPTLKCVSKKDKDLKYFRKFSEYLDQLSHHLLQMTKSMKSLQINKSPKIENIVHNSSDKLNRLNKNLENITQKLMDLSVSKTNEREIHEMVLNVTGLTGEMQRCAQSFEKLLELTVQTAAIPTTQPTGTAKASKLNIQPDQTYTEWLMQMKTSKFGRKFISSLETYQRKTMQEESDRLRKTFEDQLAQHRLLFKLHYKQKLLEKCKCMVNAANGTERVQELINFNDIIDAKLRALKEREAAAVNQKVDGLYHTNNTLKNPALSLNKKINALSRHKVAVINILPQQHPLTQSNPYVEPKTDKIVEVAKNRLLELESEGDQLERSFHSYLQRHQERNRLLNQDAKKIWQSYEIGKKLLSTNLPTKININPLNIVPAVVPVADVMTLVNESKGDKYDFDHETDNVLNKYFENPYRIYDFALRSKENPNHQQSQFKQSDIHNAPYLPKESEIKIKLNIETTDHASVPALTTQSFPAGGNQELDASLILKQSTQLEKERYTSKPTEPTDDQFDKPTVSQNIPNNEEDNVISETNVMLSTSPVVDINLPNVIPISSKLVDTPVTILSDFNSQLNNEQDALQHLNIQKLSKPLTSGFEKPVTEITIPDQSRPIINIESVNESIPAEISSAESDVQISVAKKSSSSEDFWN